MSARTNEIKERLEQFRKSDSALLKMIASRQKRLDARQNALRVAEQPIGGKLDENNRRSS